MSILVIVESPAKCKKIEQYLGSPYKCMASYGHFRNCNSLKNIDYNSKFAITFEPMEDKKSQIEKLRTAINKSKEVIIATDDDREGEAIGWHILDHFDLPLNTKRIIFHEITQSALQQSIKNPTIINMNKVYSQQARQVLDLMVGFTISPLLWKYISRTQGLSAGRCQTPALNLVYENHIENQKKEMKMSYKTIGYFMSKNFDYELNKELLTKKSVLEFLELSKSFVHLYSKKTPVRFVTAPPLPLHTSSIQQLINTHYHYSPKDIMQSCQVLYEKGYITYMRTDNKCYSKEFINLTESFITEKYGENFNSTSIDNITLKSTSAEAHESIRPTNIQMDTCKDSTCSKRDSNVYQFIYNHTLKSCMSDAYGKKLKTVITAPLDYEYSYTEKMYEFIGWKIVDGPTEEQNYFNYFKQLDDNMEVKYNKLHSKVQHKNVGSHLSEANLVQLLEKNGIGRPSTFSSLVEKIQTRGYVKITNIAAKKIKTKEYTLENRNIKELEQIKEVGGEKKRLVIQSIGLLICEWLYENHSSIFNYDYTSQMEEKLDKISNNTLTYYDICNEIHTYLSNIETDSKKMEKQIDENHSLIYGKNGFIVKTKENNKVVFKPVKPNIDFQNVEQFTLEQILDYSNEKDIGTFRDINVIIKKGKFGPYFQYDDKNYSLSSLDKPFSQINISDAITIIQNYNSEEQPNIIKQIDENLSIRNGKFGNYLYYKSSNMKKPSFISLQKCDFDYKNIDDISLFYKFIELSKSKPKNKKKY